MPSAGLKSRVEQILGTSAQVHAVAAVRLYLSEAQQAWEWTKVSGAVALATTNEPGRYLYVVDLSNNSVPLSQEIYENFGYEAPREFFHSFEMDDCVAGLSFADASDAKAFYQAVRGTNAPTTGLPQRPPPPATRPPPPAYGHSLPPTPPAPSNPAPTPPAPYSQPAPASPQQLTKSSSAPHPSAAAAAGSKKKGGGGFFTKLKSAFGATDAPEDFVVSDPRGFRHESHIGWDPDAGFEIRNIPPEWRKLFQAAGVRKADLRDAETAKFVMNVIGETMLNPQLDDAPSQRHHEAPPPPSHAPSSGGGSAPPPPPPPPAPKAPPAPGLPTVKSAPHGSPRPAPQRDVRGDLMNSIKQGTELRKVDPNDPKPGGLPDINNMNPTDSKNLVDTLALAMASRRNAIQTVDEEEDDEEWSD